MEIRGNKNGTLSKIKSAVLNTKSDIFGPTNRLSRVTEWIESEYSIPRDEFDIRYHHDIVKYLGVKPYYCDFRRSSCSLCRNRL